MVIAYFFANNKKKKLVTFLMFFWNFAIHYLILSDTSVEGEGLLY